MPLLAFRTRRPARRQRGFTLMESLVAMVVMALGILGIVGVQMRTLTDTQAGVRRAQAIRLIEDLGERLQNNPNALGNLAVYTGAGQDSGCATTACSPADLAAFDIWQWRRNMATALPGGSATVFVPAGGSRQLGVLVGWTENRYNAGGAAPTDAQTAALNAPLTVTGESAAGAVSCQAGQTCHIQYLQPLQRCAPWAIDTAALHCPN